jgi:hypothetical protein
MLPLASSIRSGPGVYAVLLGSGVSHAAEIPTGWEVTLDLISKLTAASGEADNPTYGRLPFAGLRHVGAVYQHTRGSRPRSPARC